MSNFTSYTYDGYEIDEDSDVDEIASEHSNDEFDNIEKLQDRALANEVNDTNCSNEMIYNYLHLAEKSFKSMAHKTASSHQDLICNSRSRSENNFKSSIPATDDRKSEDVSNTPLPSKKDQDQTQDPYYDDIYFDSDSEQWQTKPNDKKKKKLKKLSNDELFYDPNIDDDNELWVKSRKETPNLQVNNNYSKRISQNQNSDMVLSCPSCMSILTRDCQRHDTYKDQFRAMFVSNCNVLTEQTLRYANKKQSRRRKKKRNVNLDNTETNEGNPCSTTLGENDAIYHPVQCAVCFTEVAVYDKEEVYHFFHVIEGIS